MKSEKVQIGMTVRVREHHRTAERRGMVGRIADLLSPTVVAFAAR